MDTKSSATFAQVDETTPFLAQKKDYTGAAEQLRDYIRFAPNATDIAQVKEQLADVEKVLGPEAKKQDTEKQTEKQQ